MTTKRTNLSIKTTGLSTGAALGVIYTLIMFASLLLVGAANAGSLQAALPGIGWSTVAGFELGLLAIAIAGFIPAAVFTLTYNFIRQGLAPAGMKQANQPPARSRGFRLLAVLFVLLPVTLLSLRLLGSAMSRRATTAAAAASIQGASMQAGAVDMGSIINTTYREAEPSFTADGRTMYFNCQTGDICVSYLTGTWEQGNWSAPERLGTPISTAYEEAEPLINAAGDKLYFMSRRPGGSLWRIPFFAPFLDALRLLDTIASMRLGHPLLGGLGLPDVYVSYRTNGAWSEPRKLNDVAGEPPVDTEFADHCFFLAADGREAFWTSTRPGGFGGNDIWTARLVNGKWTAPENLGPAVNGPKDEHHSTLSPDGKSLYVTSKRAGGYGRDDLYVTRRDGDGKWGPLVNLGPLFNGPRDDRCLVWTPDGRIVLFDSVRKPGFGGRDIWWMYAGPVQPALAGE